MLPGWLLEPQGLWASDRSGRGNGGRVTAIGEFDAKVVGSSGAGVIFGEALAEAAGFDANDWVEAGIVAVVAVEDLAAEDVFLDLGGLAVDVGFDGEMEKAAEAIGVDESGTGENRLEVQAEGGRIALSLTVRLPQRTDVLRCLGSMWGRRFERT